MGGEEALGLALFPVKVTCIPNVPGWATRLTGTQIVFRNIRPNNVISAVLSDQLVGQLARYLYASAKKRAERVGT